MALTARLALTGPDSSEPEDFLASSLGVIFPDDVTNQHGDADHGLLYTSPHLPKPLQFALAEVEAEEDRHLFSHYLWNSSLMLAELIEAGTLCLEIPHAADIAPPISDFDIVGLSSIELGAGTALPSIMSGLLGARRVVVTDYPASPVLQTLRHNVISSIVPANSPPGRLAVKEILIEGHGWGELDTPLAQTNKHAFDRVLVADCLWMPWQHGNLRESIAWFLGEGEGARAWVVAGFHTGREKMRRFFDKKLLAEVSLEVERIWERDCDGEDREWVWDRGIEDISIRKRWLAIASLKRIGKPEASGSEGRDE